MTSSAFNDGAAKTTSHDDSTYSSMGYDNQPGSMAESRHSSYALNSSINSNGSHQSSGFRTPSESNDGVNFKNNEFISGETIRMQLVSAAFVAYSYSGAEISYPSKPFLRRALERYSSNFFKDNFCEQQKL